VKGPRPRASAAEDEALPLVSVVAPTSWVRRGFHPLLYECFCKQEIGGVGSKLNSYNMI
jgi:hypothetical protein